MELVARPLDLGAVNEMKIEVYPHVQPGTDHPFDAYFGGVNLQTDPVGFARSSLFHSADVTSADQPDGGIGRNWTGFTDPRVDDLIAAGYATYDQTKRARIYRDLQGVLVEQQPYYFGFADGDRGRRLRGSRLAERPAELREPALVLATGRPDPDRALTQPEDGRGQNRKNGAFAFHHVNNARQSPSRRFARAMMFADSYVQASQATPPSW